MPRTALVTGGSRGIGQAIAQELARAGVAVVAPTRQELDLADGPSIARWLAAARLRPATAAIDILVNNAGINDLGRISELPPEALSRMLQVNLAGPFALLQGLLPGMCERGWGRVVNIASVWSVVAREGRGGYAATKAGLNGLTRVAAVEAARQGVLVNAVAPGFIATELTFKNMPPQDIKEMEGRIPAARLGKPAEVARLVRWLCSEENSYMTGQVLLIDGGYSIV
jgi:NAD(P)-dependent dehydrogenase (short-subunit alcohol dehydrogenase family)